MLSHNISHPAKWGFRSLSVETWWPSFTEVSILCSSLRAPNGAGSPRRMKTNIEIINMQYVTHATS